MYHLMQVKEEGRSLLRPKSHVNTSKTLNKVRFSISLLLLLVLAVVHITHNLLHGREEMLTSEIAKYEEKFHISKQLHTVMFYLLYNKPMKYQTISMFFTGKRKTY